MMLFSAPKLKEPKSLSSVAAGAAGGLDGVTPALLRRHAASEYKDEEKEFSLVKFDAPPPLRAMSKAGSSYASLGKGGKAGLPKPINLTPTYKVVHAFNCTSAVTSVSINTAEIFGALGGICTVANSVVSHWTSSFRILWVKIWPSVSTTAVSQTVIEWSSGVSPSNPDQCISLAVPGGVVTPSSCVVFTPPKNSSASFWNNTSTLGLNLFQILNLPNASILHLAVECTLPVVFSGTVATSTVATGSLGSIYYLPLDGTTSHKIVHDTGYPATF